MFKHPPLIIMWAAILMIFFCGCLQSAQNQTPALDPTGGAIICRAMEVFEDAKLGVRAVIFHQRDKADGPRLGSLLLQNSGKEMEVVTTHGQRFRATVFRAKSAFGRGLMLLPASNVRLRERDEFTLRLAKDN